MSEKIIPTMGVNNCGSRCIVNVHMEDGKIKKLSTVTKTSDDQITYTACPRGLNYDKTFLGDNRLQYPMKRIGKRGEGKFERISWDEAIDIMAKEWVRIRDTYGPGSRYVQYATGVEGLMAPNVIIRRLLNLDGGFLGYYNSYSSAQITKATELMYGTAHSGSSLDQWLHTNLIILVGHSPVETGWDHDTMHYLLKARKKGIPIICIDPRKNDTCIALGAKWIGIRPNTDAALFDAMAYEIYTRNLHNQDFLDTFTIGFDENHMPEGIDPSLCYLDYLLGKIDNIKKDASWASSITGIDANTIIDLAIQYASTKPAALILGYGSQRHNYGEQNVRGAITLASMTGNIGIDGGWASGKGACKQHIKPELDVLENPYGAKIPSFLWTEAVVRGHEMTSIDGVVGRKQLDSDIKMIFNLASNTLINQHSNINETKKLLEDESKVEFIVASDLFMTASAKYADLLLPGVSMFETNNISLLWAYSNILGASNKVIEPLYESRLEYDWMLELADRLGYKEEFSLNRTSDDWLEITYNELRKKEPELCDYRTFRENGIFEFKDNKTIIGFEDQIQNHVPFPTRSGKIEIFSQTVYETEYKKFMPAIPMYVEAEEGIHDPLIKKYPLQLIGYHSKRRAHTIHDENKALEKLDPRALWMNPKDAKDRNINNGDLIHVYNDRGTIEIPVRITDRIIEGVCTLSQGAWYKPNKEGIDTNGSINVLTSLIPSPYARGNGQHSILVEVKKV